MKPLREHNHISDNPVGLSTEAVEAIIPELDAHTSSLFVLFHQYQKHHWLVEGPQFRDLHLFLGENYKQIHDDVDALAERVTLLGGIPTSSPANQEKRAYIKVEPEGQFPIRESLRADMEAEGRIARAIRNTIKVCTEHGDFGTRNLLESILVRVEDRAHHIEHFLGDDSLARKEELSAL